MLSLNPPFSIGGCFWSAAACWIFSPLLLMLFVGDQSTHSARVAVHGHREHYHGDGEERSESAGQLPGLVSGVSRGAPELSADSLTSVTCFPVLLVCYLQTSILPSLCLSILVAPIPLSLLSSYSQSFFIIRFFLFRYFLLSSQHLPVFFLFC